MTPLFLSLLLLLQAPVDPEPVSWEFVRTIPITPVTDAEFRALGNYRGKIRTAVSKGSEDLESLAGIRFAIGDELQWEAPAHLKTLPEILDTATRDLGDHPGILVLFLGGSRFETRDESRPMVAYAYLGRGGMVLIATRSMRQRMNKSLTDHLAVNFRHELGHVFGIPHLGMPGIMNPVFEERTWFFSQLAVDILRATRLMDFDTRERFLGCDLETLADVYRILARRGEVRSVSLANLGDALAREGHPETAQEMYDLAVAGGFEDGAGELALAHRFLTLGDSVAADSLLREASRSNDLSPRECAEVGRLWRKLGEPGLSRVFLDRAILAEPDQYQPWFDRGLLWFAGEEYAAAREDFRQAIAVDGLRPEAWFNLGLCCDALLDRECAVEAFRRVLELDPGEALHRDAEKFLERQERLRN